MKFQPDHNCIQKDNIINIYRMLFFSSRALTTILTAAAAGAVIWSMTYVTTYVKQIKDSVDNQNRLTTEQNVLLHEQNDMIRNYIVKQKLDLPMPPQKRN